MNAADIERFWSKVDKSGECWEWTGGRSRDGYGHFHLGGRTLLAHRVSHELIIGTIPDGLHIDHLCRNPPCVRPEHIEPVTPRINNLRGVGLPALNASKTHCPQGHPYDQENTLPTPSGGRACRTCSRARFRAWWAKQPPGPGRQIKTHCPSGHPYDGENTYVTPDGKRACRICRRAHGRTYDRRRRAQ